MAQFNVPDSPTLYSVQYDSLKGVDYSCDLTEVSRKRTPTGTNMISDDGGNPVKRRGWRKHFAVGCGKIFEIIFHEDQKASGYDDLKIYVIGQTGIYAIVTANGVTSKQTMLQTTITSCSYFMFDGEVYAIINGGMYKLEGITASSISTSAYIPEVVISKNPDGSGGTSLEDVNILTQQRMFSFLGDASSTAYYLYPTETRTEEQYKYIKADSVTVQYSTTNGWVTAVAGTDYTLPTASTVKALDELGNVTDISVCDAYITFTSAHAPVVTGQDNVRITFSSFDNNDSTTPISAGSSTMAKNGLYKEARVDLLATKTCMTYGYAAVDRVFCVGGNQRNKIYYSAVNQPMYFPDTNYLTVGHDTAGVVGLHRVSEYLAAVKEDSSIEGTVFLISGSYLNQDDEQKVFFKVSPTSAGTGAIASKSFDTLVDEPLFLSRNGVYAIANYYTTTEKVIRNRSYYIDKKLLAESNLEDACAITWRRYYIICVNNHCYILDGRSKSQDRNNNTDYLYEAYYWENVPAKVFCVHQNELWFGDASGNLCKFNTDINDLTAYCDDGTLTASGVLTGGDAIYCEWTTPLDDDGKPQYYKTLNKKGTMLTVLPYDRTSATVSLIKDGEVAKTLGIFYADIFNWQDIDFTRFTFAINDTAQDDFFKTKIKKYKRLQIKIENNAIYEPFGILGIVKTYFVNGFAKK